MKKLLRALNYFRADGWQIALIVALLLLSIGLNILKPWPLALVVDCVLSGKPIPSWAPKAFAEWGQAKQLTILIGTLLALHLGHATISAAQLYLSIGVGLRGLCRARNDVFGWLQRLSLRCGNDTETGDIIFRAGTDACAFQTLFQQGLLMFINAFCTLLFMLVVMFGLNLRLTLLSLFAVPFLLASIKMFGRVMRDRGLAAQQAESKVYSLIHHGITALPLIQSNTREHDEQKRFSTQTERAQQSKMSQDGVEVLYWFVVSLILSASTVAVTWFGARQVLASALTLGELLVFLAYLGQMFEPLNQLTQVGATISSASASTGRVFQILDTPEEVKDRIDARPVQAPGRIESSGSKCRPSSLRP